MFWFVKDNYPIIALYLMLILLLLDVENYIILTIFSNLFGFSFFTNQNLLKKFNGVNRLSIYAMYFVNSINIISCLFIDYAIYFRLLTLLLIIITLIIPATNLWNRLKSKI